MIQVGELGGFDREGIAHLDKANRVRTGCAAVVQEDDDELLGGIIRTNPLGRLYIRPADFGCLHARNSKVARCGPGRFRVFFSNYKGASSTHAIERKRATYEISAIPADPVEVSEVFFCQCRRWRGRSLLGSGKITILGQPLRKLKIDSAMSARMAPG